MGLRLVEICPMPSIVCLLEKGFDSEISKFLKVALDCIGLSSNDRPTMLEVYKSLSSEKGKRRARILLRYPCELEMDVVLIWLNTIKY